MLSLVFTSDASTSVSTKAKNTIILISPWALTQAYAQTKAQQLAQAQGSNFFHFLDLVPVLMLALQQVKTKLTTRIFTTRGYVWPMKTLNPDYLVPKQFGRFG